MRLRPQMTHVGAARDESQPSICGQCVEMPQSRSKALVLGIPRALPNIKPVDEQSIADVGRIISSVKTVVAHQHVQAVNTPREKCNALPGARERLAVRAAGSFDRGHRRWHSTP